MIFSFLTFFDLLNMRLVAKDFTIFVNPYDQKWIEKQLASFHGKENFITEILCVLSKTSVCSYVVKIFGRTNLFQQFEDAVSAKKPFIMQVGLSLYNILINRNPKNIAFQTPEIHLPTISIGNWIKYEIGENLFDLLARFYLENDALANVKDCYEIARILGRVKRSTNRFFVNKVLENVLNYLTIHDAFNFVSTCRNGIEYWENCNIVKTKWYKNIHRERLLRNVFEEIYESQPRIKYLIDNLNNFGATMLTSTKWFPFDSEKSFYSPELLTNLIEADRLYNKQLVAMLQIAQQEKEQKGFFYVQFDREWLKIELGEFTYKMMIGLIYCKFGGIYVKDFINLYCY
jgi:hypothetical protein